MKVLQLAQARLLLWARERGCEPFEVSKVVSPPLQPRCASAPRCPGEEEGEPGRPVWVDPTQAPRPLEGASCPYAFETRGDCLRTRNQLALEGALFRPSEVRLTQRLLEALGYQVSEEAIDPAREPGRILKAHGHLGTTHEVRLLRSPSAGSIVLVRELRSQRLERTRAKQRLKVLGGRFAGPSAGAGGAFAGPSAKTKADAAFAGPSADADGAMGWPAR